MKNLFAVAVILGVATIAGSAAAFNNNRILTKTATTSSCFTQLAMVSPTEFAKSEIASNDVVVFSKTFCPYCTSTKKLFSDMNVNAKIIELDKLDNGADIQSALLDITGQRTVPNVFIKGKHLGGNDVTQAAAKNGKLMEMMGK
jgi:glutaredoxin 3